MGHILTLLTDGSTTLTETRHGQAMHSKLGAWREACSVYAEASGISAQTRPQVLWDVGMGTAANALAAYENSTCPLEIWSFENDLDGIRTALRHAKQFPWLLRHQALVNELLGKGSAALPGGRGRWHLCEGDFHATHAQAPGPTLIFWDFYSPSVVPHLWSLETFQTLKRRCQPETLWISYAAATPVRAALLLAGFQVGRGPGTSAKAETTWASPSAECLPHLLGKDWLGKIDRSSRPLPYGYAGTRESLKHELLSSVHFV